MSSGSVSSGSVSSGSSDEEDVSLRLVGDAQVQRKFRRLRRIFLSQSRSPRRPQAARQHGDGGSEDESESESAATPTRPRGGVNKRVQGAEAAVGPLQLEIDAQIRALCEHAELLAAQHDARANQRESALRGAIEELQALQTRQRQAAETQTRAIEESYALRLEVLEKRHRAAVAELRRERSAAVQRRREESERAVLAAAEQLQRQAQAELLGESVHGRPVPASTGTARARSGLGTWTFRTDVGRSTQRRSSPAPASPMTRQRAKLQALEQKLRAFPQASVARVTCKQQLEATAIGRKDAPPSLDTRRGADAASETPSRWPPTPLSPLRSSPSRWRRGVSREVRSRMRVIDTSRTRSSAGSDLEKDGSESEPELQRLMRRFLRPEEARELLRLRNSIGLATDWMEETS